MPQIAADGQRGGRHSCAQAVDESCFVACSQHLSAGRARHTGQCVLVEARIGHLGIDASDEDRTGRGAQRRRPRARLGGDAIDTRLRRVHRRAVASRLRHVGLGANGLDAAARSGDAHVDSGVALRRIR